MNDTAVNLPGLDCGLCGYRTCAELADRLTVDPGLLKRCIHLSNDRLAGKAAAAGEKPMMTASCIACPGVRTQAGASRAGWQDSLGREFDFYLEHFPEDPGPREIILPHNPIS